MGKLLKSKDGSLLSEFIELLEDSQRVDISVGYANIGGFNLIMKALEKVDKIRVLIGMSENRDIKNVLSIMKNDILNENTRVSRFIELVKSGKLEIRFDKEGKNHAKGYIFTKRDGNHSTILGSNNMTYEGFKINKEWASSDQELYYSMLEDFEEEWEKAVSDYDLVEMLEEELKENPKPIILSQYEMFIKVLHDLYGGSLDSDLKGSVPADFKLLKYQEDAVFQLDSILSMYNGCFLSDVVGLGKTYVSALSLLRLPQGSVPLVIVPAGVLNTWKSVLKDFGLENVEITTHHQLNKYVTLDGKGYRANKYYTHIYVDEAHKFRNVQTIGYKMLKALCNIERGTKVILITATPLNNNPKELKNMLALFQNLHGKNSLIHDKSLSRYLSPLIRGINKARATNDKEKIAEVLEVTSEKLRKDIINKITIRRTRKDIVKFYKDDLIKNGWVLPTVHKPKRIEYDLSHMQSFVLDKTQEMLSKMYYARYKLHDYIFKHVFEKSHKYLYHIIRVNMMKRMDSSIHAFTETLLDMINKHEQTVKDFENGFVRKVIQHDELGDEIVEDRIPISDLEKPDAFINHIKSDLAILKDLWSVWKGTQDNKLDELVKLLQTMNLKDGKVIIFSQYKDTVEYLERELNSRNFSVLAYHAGVDNKRKIVDANFDANAEVQSDDYDILVTTDALSEGVNLHRANKVINYDIAWNPTVVIQRVGRVNRIGTKFEDIYIYNFFPFDGTDKVIKSEKNIISKLKTLFHLYGDDNNVLTDDDDPDSIETIESQIQRSIVQTNEEESQVENSASRYQSILRHAKNSNKSWFNWLTSLQGDLIVRKNADLKDIEALSFVRQDGSCSFYVLKDGVVRSLDVMEALSLLECDSLSEQDSDFSLEKALKYKDMFLKHVSKMNAEVFIAEDMGFDTGGMILQYLKKLYRLEQDAEIKAEIKQIHDNVKNNLYIVDKHVENEMKEVVRKGGSFEELKELFEECELKSNSPQIVSVESIFCLI